VALRIDRQLYLVPVGRGHGSVILAGITTVRLSLS